MGVWDVEGRLTLNQARRDMTKQPEWKLIAQLGDVNPIEHGGLFLYEDKTGVYAPELAFVDKFEIGESELEQWVEHRLTMEPCTYLNGILSDNKFHPEHPAWFASKIGQVADFAGYADKEEMISHLCGNEGIICRARAWASLVSYHGPHEFDGYPLSFNRDEITARYPRETWRVGR